MNVDAGRRGFLDQQHPDFRFRIPKDQLGETRFVEGNDLEFSEE